MGSDIKPSEITDEKTYLKRREFILGAGLGIGLTAAPFMAAEELKRSKKVISLYEIDATT